VQGYNSSWHREQIPRRVSRLPVNRAVLPQPQAGHPSTPRAALKMTIEPKLNLLSRSTKLLLGEIPLLKLQSSKACPDAIPKVSITSIYGTATNSNTVPAGPNPRCGKVGFDWRTHAQAPQVPRPRTKYSHCPGAEPLYNTAIAQCLSIARSVRDSFLCFHFFHSQIPRLRAPALHARIH